MLKISVYDSSQYAGPVNNTINGGFYNQNTSQYLVFWIVFQACKLVSVSVNAAAGR